MTRRFLCRVLDCVLLDMQAINLNGQNGHNLALVSKGDISKILVPSLKLAY